MVGSPLCNLFVVAISHSLLLVVGVGWYALGVNLLLLLCFFLIASAYYLISSCLNVLLLVCMGASCCSF